MNQKNFFKLTLTTMLLIFFTVNVRPTDVWSNRGCIQTNTTHRYFNILDGDSPAQPITKHITGTTFTFETWFYLDDMNQAKGRFFYINNGAQFGFTNDGNSLLIQNFGAGRTVDIWLAYKTLPEFSDLTAGRWVHIALVVDGNNWKVYLDGTVRYNQDRAGGYMTNTTNFLIGGDWWGPFLGKIADTRVWSTARTGAQIQADMRKILASSTPNLIGRINFDEGSGQRSQNYTSIGGGAWAHAGGATINWGLVSKRPTNLQTPSITNDGFTLTWEGGSETEYLIALTNTSTTNTTYYTTTNKSYTFTGLSASTTYHVKVMSSKPLETGFSAGGLISLITTSGINNKQAAGVKLHANESHWQIYSQNGYAIQAQVYSLSGNCVGEYYSQNQVMIDKSDFGRGVYIIKVNSLEGKSVFKVIK